MKDYFGVVIIGNLECYIIDIVLVMGWCFDVSKVVFCSEKVVVIGVGLVGLGCVDILVCVGV